VPRWICSRKDQKEYAAAEEAVHADNSKEIARLASEMKSLDEAMNPKDAREHGRRQARSLSNIAEQEERRVAAAKALDAAASAGPSGLRSGSPLAGVEEQAPRDRAAHPRRLPRQEREAEGGTEAAMQAEIARAQAALCRRRTSWASMPRAALDIEKDESVLAVLKAKQDAYRAGGPVKDATSRRSTPSASRNAMAIADDAQRAKKLALAEAIRDQTYATNASADAAAKEKHAQEQAQREAEQRARQIQRATASAIEQALTDVSNGQNPARAFFAMLKQATIRAISEALAEKFLASASSRRCSGSASRARRRHRTSPRTRWSIRRHRILHAAETCCGRLCPRARRRGRPARRHRRRPTQRRRRGSAR
jgi:hypothetical protein